MMKTILIKTFFLLSFIPMGLLAQEVNGSIYMIGGSPFLEADQNHIFFSVSPGNSRALSKNILFTNTANLPVYINRISFSSGIYSKFQITNIGEGTVIESKENIECKITFSGSRSCMERDTLKVYFSNSNNPLKVVLEAKKELIVSPNPTDGQVTLQGSFYKTPLMVYDAANGNVVLETKLNGVNPIVNLGNLPPRPYIFKMECVSISVIKN